MNFKGKPFSKLNTTDNPNYEFSMGNQVLIIYSVNRTSDFGLYTCLAENSVNRISANARLTIRQGS